MHPRFGMSSLDALRFPIRAVEAESAMDDERRSETPGRRESDAKSAWNDPRFWLSVLSFMMIIVLALLGYISSQLAAVNAYVKATNDAVLIVTTKQAADAKSIEDRVSKLENAVTTQQQAYNFNFTTRLANVEARAGIKPASKDE
jgi:hypothetical protein